MSFSHKAGLYFIFDMDTKKSLYSIQDKYNDIEYSNSVSNCSNFKDFKK